MVQSAEIRPRHDRARSVLDRARLRRVAAERLVATRRVVVLDVLAQHGAKVALAERDDVVRALTADAADDALDARRTGSATATAWR